jgi:hypothetical protein
MILLYFKFKNFGFTLIFRWSKYRIDMKYKKINYEILQKKLRLIFSDGHLSLTPLSIFEQKIYFPY